MSPAGRAPLPLKLAALVLFLSTFAGCSGYRPVKKITIPTGPGTNEISVSFGSNGAIGVPAAIVLKNGFVWIAETGTSCLKIFDLNGAFRGNLRLSVGGRRPAIGGLMIGEKQGIYVFEDVAVTTGSSNGEPVDSTLLHRFSPDGEYMKTLASITGLLRDARENSYGQLTAVLQDPGSDWTVRKFDGGIPVRSLRFPGNITSASDGSVINGICPLGNDNILLVERIRLPYGDRPSEYSFYDVLTDRESPVELLRPHHSRDGYSLYGTDRSGRIYLMRRSGRNRISVLRMDLPSVHPPRPVLHPVRRWALASRNADGLLLEPRIDSSGNVYQVRLGRGHIRIILYR